MKVLIINGANLNMLAYRDEMYGNITYDELCSMISKQYNDVDFYQSNYEGDIVEKLHDVVIDDKYEALIINPGAFTYYSYAIYDALEMVKQPIVEVHLTNIYEREAFRAKSIFTNLVVKTFYGKQVLSYFEALDYLIKNDES